MARSPFFVLIGDSFLCEEKRKELLRLLEKEFGPNLSFSLARAGEIPTATLLSEARTLPFLAPAQVFCVREADQWTKTDLELWKAYLESPASQSFFIFEAESLDKNHPLLTAAEKARQVFFLRAQQDRIVADFVRRKLQGLKKRMTPEALSLLESRVGDSLIFLDSVLEQLVLSLGEKEEIDRAAVESFEETLRQWEGEDLIQALAEKNLPKALEVLYRLLETGGQELPSLVGLLHWQFRRFWQGKKWLAQGVSEREITLRLKLWPSRVEAFFKQLTRFSLKELEQILEGLFILDWQLKTGRAEGRYEMEAWLATSIG